MKFRNSLYAPVALDVPASIYVRNVHAVDELRAIAARLNATSDDETSDE